MKPWAIIEMAFRLFVALWEERHQRRQQAKYEQIKADPNRAFADKFGEPVELPDHAQQLPGTTTDTHTEMEHRPRRDSDP